MTISVSVLSHAFFTEKGVSRGGRDLCSPSPRGAAQQQEENAADDHGCKADAMAAESSQDQPMEPMVATAAAKETASGKAGKKRGNRKRGARGRHNVAEKEARISIVNLPDMNNAAMATTSASTAPAACPYNSYPEGSPFGVAEVLMRDIREECSAALGIVKEDLELFGLCHLPRSSDRVRLLKDKSGIMHVGVMVRNSDLSLRTIEELLVNKNKAELEAESCRLQMSEKTDDLCNLKSKYDKLAEEVLRLRTMVARANHLRKESEKATEILRIEFEKLVKSLFMEDTGYQEQRLQDDDDDAS